MSQGINHLDTPHVYDGNKFGHQKAREVCQAFTRPT